MVSTAPRRASLTCRLNLLARALRLSRMGIPSPRTLTSMVSPRPKLSRLSMVTLPTADRALESAAGTIAQGFGGARASALGSEAESSRQNSSTALMCLDKIADSRDYFRAEARPVEDAVMADAGLHVVLTHGRSEGFAQNLCSIGLPQSGNVVLFPLDGHQAHPVDLGRVNEPVAVHHGPLGQLVLEKDGLDGLEIVLGREVHHREELVIELAVLVGRIAVAANEVMEQLAMGRDVAVEIHAHEAAELKEARIDESHHAGIGPWYLGDDVVAEPVEAAPFSELVDRGRALARIARARQEKHRARHGGLVHA